VRVDFEPRIMAFVCNWCTYTGADLAGTSRLQMASNVRIIRLPCTGRIDHMFIIKAFERGADGVIVSGCHPADCHYTAGNYHARRRFTVFRELMGFMGIDPGRVTFSWVSASEGAKWKDVVDETVARVRGLGPFTAYRELTPDEAVPDALWSEGVETGAASTPWADDDAAADGLALGPPNGANLPAAASSSADRGGPAEGGEL
jgi:F420-non-reducing hydrogenase iron-sulfur subunit